MEINVNSKELLAVLKSAYKAIPSKTAMPILENYLFSVSGNILTVTASDGSITISHRCECESTQDSKAVIPAKTLLELTQCLSEGSVRIICDEASAKVDWEKGHSSIPVFKVEDYPVTPVCPDITPLTIDSDTLKAAFAHIVPCIGEDELRPQLNGVFFDVNAVSTNLVASDTHILTVYSIMKGGDVEPFILPASAVNALNSSISASQAEFFPSEASIHIRMGDYELVTKKVNGKFPNYNAIIPTGNENVMTCERTKILSTIKRVSTCANKASRMIKLSLSPFGSRIEAQDVGYQCSAQEDLDVTYEGAEMTVGLKDIYALKAISPLDTQTVTLKFKDSSHAILVEGEGDPTQTIVMPVKVC